MVLCVLLFISLAACNKAPVSVNEPSGSKSGPEGDTPVVNDKIYEFNFACDDAATAPASAVFDEWVDEVFKASNGRIKITMYYGGVMGAAAEQLNLVETGAADMTHVGIGHYPGRFTLCEVFGIPGLKYEDAAQVVQAVEWLYKNNEQYAAEISEVKVLGYRANCKTPISHKGAPWETANDIKGVRVNSSNAATNALTTSLGMIPTSVAFPDRYEAMSKNIIDAITSDWVALEAFACYEVVDSICDISISINTGFIAMSWKAWNSLPADLQQILEECSASLGQRLAAKFKEIEIAGMEGRAAEFNVTVYKPNAEVQAAIDAAAIKAREGWIADANSKGYDGETFIEEVQAALDMFKP